jgi:hypothetical protein
MGDFAMVLKACSNLLITAVALWATSQSDFARAQVIVGRGGGGLSIGIPGLGGVRVGPALRRGVVLAPSGVPYGYPYGAPYAYGYGPVPRYAARPVTQDTYTANAYAANAYETVRSLPTAGDLRVMSDSELLNATTSLAAQLQEDLNRFDTGDTWQHYLGLPPDALPPATEDGQVFIGRESLIDTLARFDRTVANGRYVQISSLPSYAAMHAALAELVRRYGAETEAPTVQSGVVPPAVPRPPQASVVTTQPGPAGEYEPQSIEMRNLHAAPQRAPANTSEAGSVPTGEASEELPSPPPSLVAPSNESTGERSVLSR